MKKTLLLLTLALSFLPTAVFGQAAQPNAVLDQRCYTQTSCTDAGTKNHLDTQFFVNADQGACPTQMFNSASQQFEDAGFCSPIGEAELKIGIGGKKTFTNVAEYIKYVYKYSMVAAITLAVLMLIVAGLQWLTSGGDSSKIESAKKRISGAIIGVVLLATSFTILKTINPALVELRIPQVWMIRGDALANPWCSELPSTTPLAIAYDKTRPENERNIEIPPPEPLDPWHFRSTPVGSYSGADCGNKFYIAGAGQQVCEGTDCAYAQIFSTNDILLTCTKNIVTNEPECAAGNVIGYVHGEPDLIHFLGANNIVTDFLSGLRRTFTGEGWAYPWLMGGDSPTPDDVNLYVVCSNGKFIKTNHYLYSARPTEDGFLSNPDTLSERFAMSLAPEEINRLMAECSGTIGGSNMAGEIVEIVQGSQPASVKGFVIALDLQEAGSAGGLKVEEHFISKNGTDLGQTESLFTKCFLRLASQSSFISLEELRTGISIDISINNISDIENNEVDEPIAYRDLGYTTCLPEAATERTAETESQQYESEEPRLF